jgi:23S rRNA (uracil1939-C5)-methyltransferase
MVEIGGNGGILFEAIIEKLLNNGYGLARDPEGRVVFVSQALPGERVSILETTTRKGTLYASKWRRLNDHENRQEPACEQFDRCGGCDLLYVKRNAEVGFKKAFLEDVLQRIGKLDSVQVEVLPFPFENSRHRGKFHLDASGVCGFLEKGSKQVVAFEPCLVLPQVVLEQGLRLGALLHRHRYRGEIWFLVSEDQQSVAFEFQLKGIIQASLKESLADFCSANVGVLVRGNRKKVLASFGLWKVTFSWNGHRVALTPAQFMQTNPAAWSVFWGEIDRFMAMGKPQDRVWDAHAGSGFLASRLPPQVELFASEPDERGVAQLKRLPHGKKCIFRGTAEAFLNRDSEALRALDAVILDPPRAGLEPQLRKWLIAHGPQRMLYFSCDIATFSRDLSQLKAAYDLLPIRAFNMSPGTLKLESAVILIRKNDTSG